MQTTICPTPDCGTHAYDGGYCLSCRYIQLKARNERLEASLRRLIEQGLRPSGCVYCRHDYHLAGCPLLDARAALSEEQKP